MPQEGKFFDLFNTHAEQIVLGSQALLKLLTVLNDSDEDAAKQCDLIDDIENNETVELITQLLEKHEGIGKRIIFEILESEAIERYEGTLEFIAHVRRYGCRIAIDDFGSGYSNFARILNLAVDIIKIDGSLIRHLDNDSKAVTIVQTIVNFTRAASIETVAEFVHNEAVAQIVRSLGIDAAQGFYFYEPSPLPLSPE